VIRTEADVLERAVEHLRAGFAPEEIAIVLDPNAAPPPGVVAVPLSVKGRPAGLLTVSGGGPVSEHDRALLATLAGQLSVAVENARMYRDLDRLFRQYLSPDVATALLADPSQAALGGEERDVTVLFADLQGFTTFSERRDPAEVVQMLNHYFGLATPIFLAEHGTVAHFIGDALMVLFNAPIRQPDHAHAAARAAVAVCERIDATSAAHPEWPKIRIGINSGPALIGNIGGEDVRSFTAIGDTVNLASRLESLAPPGQIVIGEATRALLGDSVRIEPLGSIEVKGKAEPVRAYVLLRDTRK
jgi:class 3 adenylate cyclase